MGIFLITTICLPTGSESFVITSSSTTKTSRSVAALQSRITMATASVSGESSAAGVLVQEEQEESTTSSASTATAVVESRPTEKDGTAVAAAEAATTMATKNVNDDSDTDDMIKSNLERARMILEKSRQKLEAKKTNGVASTSSLNGSTTTKQVNGEQSTTAESAAVLPFFASMVSSPPSSSTSRSKSKSSNSKRKDVIKTIDEATGLITTDGEKMASLSEQEEWAVRGLFDVFENENKDGTPDSNNPLADRDVAASIYNLRKVLQNEDYKRIFDKRNRFIGEDN